MVSYQHISYNLTSYNFVKILTWEKRGELTPSLYLPFRGGVGGGGGVHS